MHFRPTPDPTEMSALEIDNVSVEDFAKASVKFGDNRELLSRFDVGGHRPSERAPLQDKELVDTVGSCDSVQADCDDEAVPGG